MSWGSRYFDVHKMAYLSFIILMSGEDFTYVNR